MGDDSTVLGLHFSPRLQGSSKALLDEFGLGVAEAGLGFRTLSVAEVGPISGCRECGSCNTDGQCVVRDDMDVFYEAFESAAMVVVATPVFFYDIPAQGKAVIDRSQACWARRYVLGRYREGREGARGFLLGVGATRGKDLFMPATLAIKYFFDALALPKIFDTLFFRKIETPAALTREQLLSARAAGAAFAKR
jgi:multimeric flavodoxin WrbA